MEGRLTLEEFVVRVPVNFGIEGEERARVRARSGSNSVKGDLATIEHGRDTVIKRISSHRPRWYSCHT
jgi:hypothetical protein